MKRCTALAALAAVAVLAAGCAKGPRPDYYLLSSPTPLELPGFEQGVTIGVGPIELPPHLDRNQIVSRQSETRLRLSELEQWAEPLKAGVTRVLLTQMGLTLDSNRIYALPLKQRRNLDYQVAVDVLRLDGVLGASVVLGARWTVLSGDGRKVLLSKVSRIEQPVGGPDIDALVEAQSRAVAGLGEEIARAIESRAD